MIRVWGCTKTLRIPKRELDTDKYKCIAIRMNPDGEGAIAFMSKEANPPHYRVLCESKEMFFTHREDAMNCLEQLVHNTGKGENRYGY